MQIDKENLPSSPDKEWIEREADGSRFPDARLNKRFGKLLEQLWDGGGRPIPLACQDWAATKAAYRFLSNERVAAFEVLAGPEFDGCQSKRQPLKSDSQTRMHQDSANGYMTKTSIPAAPHTGTGNKPDIPGAISLIGKLGRVMQDQGRAGHRMKTRTRGRKMSAKNVGLAYARIGKEAVSRFRAGPILASKGHAASDALRYLFNQSFKPSA